MPDLSPETSNSPKEQYEIEKLKLEIKNLSRPLLKKASFWQILIPALIGLGTIIILAINGAFDFKSRELEMRKTILQYEVNKFQDKKDSLSLENKKLNDSNLMLSKKNYQSNSEINEAKKVLKILNDSISIKDKYVSTLRENNKQLIQIASSYKDSLDILAREIEVKLEDKFRVDSLFAFDLAVSVAPNPTRVVWKVNVISENKAPSEVRIYDNRGNLVYKNENVYSRETLIIGRLFNRGSYTGVAKQGDFKSVFKLIKY